LTLFPSFYSLSLQARAVSEAIDRFISTSNHAEEYLHVHAVHDKRHLDHAGWARVRAGELDALEAHAAEAELAAQRQRVAIVAEKRAIELEEGYARHRLEVDAMPDGEAEERRERELATELALVEEAREEARVLMEVVAAEKRAKALGRGLAKRRRAIEAMPNGVAKIKAQAELEEDESCHAAAVEGATVLRDAVTAQQAVVAATKAVHEKRNQVQTMSNGPSKQKAMAELIALEAELSKLEAEAKRHAEHLIARKNAEATAEALATKREEMALMPADSATKAALEAEIWQQEEATRKASQEACALSAALAEEHKKKEAAAVEVTRQKQLKQLQGEVAANPESQSLESELKALEEGLIAQQAVHREHQKKLALVESRKGEVGKLQGEIQALKLKISRLPSGEERNKAPKPFFSVFSVLFSSFPLTVSIHVQCIGGDRAPNPGED